MRRYWALAGFSLLVAATQIGWLTFAPVTTGAAAAMDVPVGRVGTLAAVFPIVYIVVAIPAGRWLDTRFVAALAAGALATAGASAGRLLQPANYGWLLIMQLILAAAQPVVINGIPAFAARFFPERERPLAISLASAAMFLGMVAALVGMPPLFRVGGLETVEAAAAVPAVLAGALTLWALRGGVEPAAEGPAAHPAAPAPSAAGVTSWTAMRELLADRTLWLLSGLLAIGIGLFDALSAWLEPLLAAYGMGSAAGNLLGASIVAGIAGSALLPPRVATLGAHRTMLLFATLFTAAMFLAMAALQHPAWLAAWMIADGFFLLAGFPVILDLARRLYGEAVQGTVVGLMMLASHAAGIVIIFAVQGVLARPVLAFLIMAATAAAGGLLAWRLPPATTALD